MPFNRPQYDFRDKAVLITGGTSGIGEAIAMGFAESGADIVISGRDTVRGESVRARIAAHGVAAAFKPGNIGDSAFCDGLVADAAGTLGKLDVVVNSAGIIYHATVEQTTDRQWQDTFDVNVSGMFYVCRAAVPRLRDAGGGVIINIASDAGLTGSRHLIAYCASKGAVIQMSRALALDHAHEGIRVIPLCPGDVDTPMLRGEYAQRGIGVDAGLRESAQSTPLQRVCTVEEVADLVLYAASDSARFMSGFPLVLDGGGRA